MCNHVINEGNDFFRCSTEVIKCTLGLIIAVTKEVFKYCGIQSISNLRMYLLTVGPFLRVQLQHTHFELEVSGDELVQVDHKTMG